MVEDSASSGRNSGRNLTNSTSQLVKVENDDGRLRLRWTHEGRRYSFALGLPNSTLNRGHAQRVALQIEGDIVTHNFDPTLKKYKPKRLETKGGLTSVSDLFAKFNQVKKEEGLRVGTLCKYQGTQKHLDTFFGDKPASFVGEAIAEEFTAYLKQQVCDDTVKHYLILIRACWDWGRLRHLVEFNANPWTGILERQEVAPRQRVKPFSVAEIQAIESAFKSDLYYKHYADFVTFMFGTSCRFGEAAGLKWKHVADDFLTVWIGESVSRGVRKTTKTNKARTVILSPKIAALLKVRKPSRCNPEALVFPSPEGLAINDHLFRRRAWKRVLGKVGVDYRRPYVCRHTAISHALARGGNPLEVAEAAGHDPRVLFKNYASVIERKSVFVEF